MISFATDKPVDTAAVVPVKLNEEFVVAELPMVGANVGGFETFNPKLNPAAAGVVEVVLVLNNVGAELEGVVVVVDPPKLKLGNPVPDEAVEVVGSENPGNLKALVVLLAVVAAGVEVGVRKLKPVDGVVDEVEGALKENPPEKI